MKKLILVFIWFILLMVVWTTVGYCVTAPSDIAVIAGIVIGVVFAVVSVKFFTKWSK